MNYGKDRQVKLYWSISEVCELLGLEKHILRYWENEFPQLRPRKNRAGNRIYRERDITIVRSIKQLLHVEKFTIEGARKRLRDIDTAQITTINHGSAGPVNDTENEHETEKLRGLRYLTSERRGALLNELKEIRKLLQ